MRRLIGLAALLAALAGCTSSSGGKSADPFFGRTRVQPPPTGYAAGQPAPDPSYAGPRSSATGTGLSPASRPLAAPRSNASVFPAGRSSAGGALAPPTVTLPSTGATTPAPGAFPTQGTVPPSANPSGATPPGTFNFKGATTGDRIEIPVAARQLDTPLTAIRETSLGPTAGTSRYSSGPAGATSSAVASTGSPMRSSAVAGLAGWEQTLRVLNPRPAEASPRAYPAASGAPAARQPVSATTRAIDIMDLPPADR